MTRSFILITSPLSSDTAMKVVPLVVSVLDSQSRGFGFKSRFDHYLDLFLNSPKFKSLATLLNSPTSLTPASWDS